MVKFIFVVKVVVFMMFRVMILPLTIADAIYGGFRALCSRSVDNAKEFKKDYKKYCLSMRMTESVSRFMFY